MSDEPRQMAVLEPGEVELVDTEELYHRQCHPGFLEDDGEPSSQLFRDSKKDEGKLSGTRDRSVSAAQSYTNHVQFGFHSAGTWSVTVAEVREAESRVVDDTAALSAPEPCPDGHCYIDLRHLSSKGKKRLRNILKIRARVRGRTHPLRSTVTDPLPITTGTSE